MRSPENYFQERRLTLDFISEKLCSASNRIILKEREKFTRLVAALDAMSPLKVLSRGYSIASGENGKIIKKTTDVIVGEKIKLRVEDGSIDCTVDAV